MAEFAQYESELKMFIKMPIENNSSIVILEGITSEYSNGNYSGYNQGILLGKKSSGNDENQK